MNNVWEIISALATAAAACFAAFELHSNRVESKRQHEEEQKRFILETKQRTLAALDEMQQQVFDEFINVKPEMIREIAAHCRKSENKEEYNRYRTLVARLDRFALAVNNELYDYQLVYDLAGGHLIPLYSDKMLPIIETARKNGRANEYYYNLEQMIDRMVKDRRNKGKSQQE